MKHVLLLRGINVGGHGKLPMGDLRGILKGLGAQNVATYIQSGNAVFDGRLTADDITQAIEEKAGFRRPAIVLPGPDFQAVLGENPFGPEAEADPKSVHVWIGAAPLQELETSITERGGPRTRPGGGPGVLPARAKRDQPVEIGGKA